MEKRLVATFDYEQNLLDDNSNYSPTVSCISTTGSQGFALGARTNSTRPFANLRGAGELNPPAGQPTKDINGWKLVVAQFNPVDNQFKSDWIEAHDKIDQFKAASVTAGTLPLTNNPLMFGTERLADNGENLWANYKGLLDDVRIWNYAISFDEIVELYQSNSDANICMVTVLHDFNDDCIVDLQDFAEFAAQWLVNEIVSPNLAN